MTAQLDGGSWLAGCVQAGNGVVFGYLDVSGTDSAGLVISFRVHAGGPADLLGAVPLTPGTYQIPNQIFPYGGNSYAFIGSACLSQLCPFWRAEPQFGSGTITVQTLTSTTASGSFAFTLLPVTESGATGSRVVTNGSFNVRF